MQGSRQVPLRTMGWYGPHNHEADKEEAGVREDCCWSQRDISPGPDDQLAGLTDSTVLKSFSLVANSATDLTLPLLPAWAPAMRVPAAMQGRQCHLLAAAAQGSTTVRAREYSPSSSIETMAMRETAILSGVGEVGREGVVVCGTVDATT